jgi:hypothetical protein
MSPFQLYAWTPVGILLNHTGVTWLSRQHSPTPAHFGHNTDRDVCAAQPKSEVVTHMSTSPVCVLHAEGTHVAGEAKHLVTAGASFAHSMNGL